jgi:hypothetical protein
MPERKRELSGTRKYVRKNELKKVDGSRAADRRRKAKIVAKPGLGERKGHWPPW